MRIMSLLIFYGLLIFFNQQPDPPHGPDFKINCVVCHSSKGWHLDKEIYSFDHNTTKFPLAGQHKIAECKQCHISLKFKEAKTQCFECHDDVHQNTVGSDCARCHTQESWLVNNLSDIHRRSRFPLVGAHITADCYQCHKSESLVRFDVTGINCIDCHRENYMATTSPNHIQSGISEDCYTCHPVNSFQWTGAGFTHNFFPLTQGHSSSKCTDCHLTGNFNDAKTDCYSCHQQDYQATTNPDHDISGFSINCLECHTTVPGWKPANFDHSLYPLLLAHSTVACMDCHINGNYTTTPKECYACHQQDYTASVNPNHAASAFPTTCADCHTTNPGWEPATFNHNIFPLTLGHSGVTCSDCHTNGNYTTTPTDCYSCHQQDYSSTTVPNHIASGFPTTCSQCHTTNPGWKPATFNHTFFPLTLGHSGLACIDCHKDANYSTTPTACYACHQQDFSTSTNPNHTTSGFSTTCTLCHTTNPDWRPATYTQHDTRFPVYSGSHRGEWDACSDCHPNTSNYSEFTCITCHEHNKTSMDSEHSGESGYSYTSAACYNCHPRGSAK